MARAVAGRRAGWRGEEPAIDHRRVVLLPQQLGEFFSAALPQAREADGAGVGRHTFQAVSRGRQESIEQAAIGAHQGPGAFIEPFDLLEGHRRGDLAQQHSLGIDVIGDQAHLPGHLPGRQHPSATQAGEPVDLGQAVGGDEPVAALKGGTNTGEELLIDLIDHDVSADRRRYLAHFHQRFFIQEDAAGVVQAGEHDEAGAGRKRGRHPLRVHAVVILEAPLQPVDFRPQQFRGTIQRLVAGALDQHAVAACQQGRHHQKIGFRSAPGQRHVLRPRAVTDGDVLDQRLVAVGAVAADLQLRRVHHQFAPLDRRHPAGDQVPARLGVHLRPVQVLHLAIRHGRTEHGASHRRRAEPAIVRQPRAAVNIAFPVTRFCSPPRHQGSVFWGLGGSDKPGASF